MFKWVIGLPWWAWTAVRQVGVVGLSFWISWLLRFDFIIPGSERPLFLRSLVIAASAKMLVYIVLGLHLERWGRYQAFSDLIRVLGSNILASVCSGLCIYMLAGSDFPRSIYCLDLLVCFSLSSGARFAVRFYREVSTRWLSPGVQKGLLIYGAGVAGITLAREIRDNPALGYKVIGFLDDDSRKSGVKLMGLPVLGTGEEAARVTANQKKRGQVIEEIVVAMPSATGRQARMAVARCKPTGLRCRIVPGLGELISGKLAVGKMREISVTDLLGRDPVELDLECVERATIGRSVLVTGAAGSIGSELCVQLAQFNPLRLIAFDQAESELFRLEADLRRKYPNLQLIAEVGDIRDPNQVEQVIANYAVDSIFHAAAYKHVPLMERQVCEAVRNNILGTWNLAQAAWRANVSSFLLISTDKAVNPTSIMGLTKRVAELIVSAERSVLATEKQTKFVCVRFGNVLVSNGSVVPIFQNQIAAGGPVTVTDPEMRRYFMTVQEAVQLVLQASTMGRGSEIFVLDMGQPVKILDLARNMITLAGFVPDEDIEIRFTGSRPGEKIFEELSLEGENTLPTSQAKISVFQGQRLTFQQLAPWIAELQHLLWRRDNQAIIEHLGTLVREYQPRGMKLVPVSHIDKKSSSATPVLTEPSRYFEVKAAAR